MAKWYYMEGIEMSERQFEDHLERAVLHKKLAELYEESGEYESAIENYVKVVCITRAMLGENHIIKVVKWYRKIADLYRDLEDYEKAKEYYLKAQEVEMEVFGHWTTFNVSNLFKTRIFLYFP